MNYGEALVRVMTLAKQGDSASLAALRKLMGPDPSESDPHYFCVTQNQVLCDGVKTGPRTRREVFQKIPQFAERYVSPRLWSPDSAIRAIQGCPPLEKIFWHEAQSVIGLLEAKLVCDDGLTRRDRSAIHRQLKALMSDTQVCWVTWIRNTPTIGLLKFDAIVRRWIDAPIDWSEEKWFDPSWSDRFYDVESATKIFKAMPVELRVFFGIEINPAIHPDTNKEFECAFLKQSIEEANRLAELMRVKFRFESDQRHTSPKRRSSRPAKTA